ncbi:MAG: hypothetical protein HY878_06620 [Deltaproteobacteria bacterium]|nr:hypothetical protein [Deltaproteobacteria bacterium]
MLFTGLGFFILLKKLTPLPTISLDTDWFYRKGAVLFMQFAYRVVAVIDDWVSNLYRTVGLRQGKNMASGCFKFDLGVIDGIVNGVANLVLYIAAQLRKLQTGQLQHYAVAILVGLLILLNIVFFW